MRQYAEARIRPRRRGGGRTRVVQLGLAWPEWLRRSPRSATRPSAEPRRRVPRTRVSAWDGARAGAGPGSSRSPAASWRPPPTSCSVAAVPGPSGRISCAVSGGADRCSAGPGRGERPPGHGGPRGPRAPSGLGGRGCHRGRAARLGPVSRPEPFPWTTVRTSRSGCAPLASRRCRRRWRPGTPWTTRPRPARQPAARQRPRRLAGMARTEHPILGLRRAETRRCATPRARRLRGPTNDDPRTCATDPCELLPLVPRSAP